MITRFLDWLDESAAGVIRIAYLMAGVIAVASYFSDGRVPSGLAHALDNALPWVLAGALEIHTYLTARRVRSSWQDWSAAALGSDEHEKAEGAMRLNLWILAGLLTFSMYNQLQYLASTWTPPHTPLTPPGPFPYLIRAVITPAAFMAAAFLAPMGEGMAVQVQREAHNLARLAFKAASAQWKRRLRDMQRRNEDVTGALIGMVDDPTERKVIAGIWQAMHPGELLGAPARAFPAQDAGNPDDKPTPPPGPRGGTPMPAPLEHAGVTLPAPYYVPEGDTSLLNAQEEPGTKARKRAATGAKPAQVRNLTRLRNDARTFDDLKAMGYALLDQNPALTQAKLREKLGCRTEWAAAIYSGWKNTRPREAMAQ